MKHGKLDKQPMRQEVYNRLMEAIIAGELAIGTHLDEKEISEWLGVSRTPLREAINRLTQEGLVTEFPYKGNFVRKFTANEVRELYEVRKTLEVMAIRLAVSRMNADQALDISNVVHLAADAQEADDMVGFGNHDAQFHDKIAVYSGNRMLYQMLKSLGSQIKMIRQMANQNETVVKRTQFEREQILQAISDRNEELAAKFMDEHIENVMNDVIHSLSNP